MDKKLEQPKPLPIEIEIKILMNAFDKSELLKITDEFALTSFQFNSVGTAFRQLGELTLAEKYFLMSIEINPKYDEPYAHLISLYAEQNKFDLCETIYQQGSKNATKKTYIMYHDGRVSFLKGNYQGSLMAGRCILIDEEWRDEKAIVLVIKSLLMLIKNNQSKDIESDFQEARLAWKKGLTIFPDSDELLQLSRIFSDNDQ